MKSYVVTPKDIKKEWLLIDAKDQTLGRLATKVAVLLKGKHKVCYSPHMDNGDYVIVVNASKIKLTGSKISQKYYYKHTGYTGNLKEKSYRELMDTKPTFVVEKAIKGMLPKNRLGRKQISCLRIYSDDKHKHEEQSPKVVNM